MSRESRRSVRNGSSSAFVPEKLGGSGLESIHDWILVIATLARGDASTAIAITMHQAIGRWMALVYSDATMSLGPDHDRTRQLGEALKKMAAGEMLVCATATEVGPTTCTP